MGPSPRARRPAWSPDHRPGTRGQTVDPVADRLLCRPPAGLHLGMSQGAGTSRFRSAALPGPGPPRAVSAALPLRSPSRAGVRWALLILGSAHLGVLGEFPGQPVGWHSVSANGPLPAHGVSLLMDRPTRSHGSAWRAAETNCACSRRTTHVIPARRFPWRWRNARRARLRRGR